MICSYDGSYAGLLTLLQRLFARREEPTAIGREAPAQEGLFEPVFDSTTDPALAGRLTEAIETHLASSTLKNLRQAFLSEQPGMELALYAYLKFGWKVRRELDSHLGDERVAAVHKMAGRAMREAHRMKGLLRFRETDGRLYYAPVKPDANVVPLLAPHFAARLRDRPWLIHDVRREIGALFDGDRWTLGQLTLEAQPELTDEERRWQQLWCAFFDRIAIPERRNQRLQRSFMPIKYWEYLVEMNRVKG